MSLDLREGDTLVLGGKEYPVKSCAEWPWSLASQILASFATQTASTKRSPAIVNGKRGAPATNLASVKCTPAYPASADVAQRAGLDTPHELLQVYVDGGDVCYELVLEDLKR